MMKVRSYSCLYFALKCWDVYTGTVDNLEYSYTNCINKAYWIEDILAYSLDISEGGSGNDRSCFFLSYRGNNTYI